MKKSIEKQQEFFATGETKSITYRVRMLRTLRKAILASEQDIIEALHQDLKKSKLEAYTTEIGQCLAEITFVLKHLKKWMQPQRVGGSKLFPLSSGWIAPESLGISLILSSLELSFHACGLASYSFPGCRLTEWPEEDLLRRDSRRKSA
ncbi:MAG: hypothetical protein ACYS80_23020 [Planctomycetota bacterium]|jgi:aldehyde dehydrogenase (NAD+)